MFDTNKSRILLHLIFICVVVLDCFIYISILKGVSQGSSDSSGLLAAIAIPQVIFAFIFNFYMEECNPSDYEDHLFRNIMVGFFPILAIMYIIFNLIEYIAEYKKNRFSENLAKIKVGRHSAKILIKDFENLFEEFNLAEAKSLLENGSNLDSEYIAQQSLARIQGIFISKHHLSPEQFEEVVNLYVQHNSFK